MENWIAIDLAVPVIGSTFDENIPETITGASMRVGSCKPGTDSARFQIRAAEDLGELRQLLR